MSAEETKKPKARATKKADSTPAPMGVTSASAAPTPRTMTANVVSAEVASGKMLKVTLLRSPIRSRHNHKNTIKALGLHRINDSHTLPDNAPVRGMIHAVKQWVKVEEVGGSNSEDMATPPVMAPQVGQLKLEEDVISRTSG